MSDANNGKAAKPTMDELEAQIAKARLDLTSTVDELSDRVDPRVQIAELKATVSERAKAFTQGLKSGDPKSLGIVAGGVAALGLVIVVSIRRR